MSAVAISDTNSLTSMIGKFEHHPSVTGIENHIDELEKPNFNFK